MKNEIFNIIANDELCDYFVSSAKSDSLLHAYILLGEKGTGKHTLARFIATTANCSCKKIADTTVPCLSCRSCNAILAGNNPDITVISREKDRATLGVDQIRFIKEDLAFVPNESDFKIYIIEDAHTMTIQAQNALLLSLEEPPPYAMFILLCEHTETILDTIKSRAPILRMKIPSESEALEYLKNNFPSARMFINSSPDEFRQIYMASKGSIGRILELIGSTEKAQILQDRELAQKLIEAIAHRTVAHDFGLLASMFSQKRDERSKIIAQLSQIQCALRDLLVIKKADHPSMTFFTDSQYAEELSYSFSAQQILRIIESSEEARISLLRNSNVKLTITNFLSSLI